MYSVVLMAAMTAGTNAPDFWLHKGGKGWHGAHGCAATCYGNGYSPYGCAGCAGWSAGVGCYGGWYGSGWGAGLAPGMTGNYECWGGHGCYGSSGYMGCAGYQSAVSSPETIPAPRVDTATSSRAPDRARLTVELPRDAKLYIDGQLMKSSAEQRTFNTPRLDRRQTYYYEVKAEAVRDGKPVTESKRVLVRAGEDVKVAFAKLEEPSVAAKDDRPSVTERADVTRRGRE